MKKGLVCLLVVMAGCYTPKKADKHLAKAMDEYPEKVAFLCKDEFPCKPGKIDTVEKVFYDLIEVECPDYPVPVQIRDTVEKVKEKVRVVKIQVPGKERIITKYVIDSALVKVYQSKFESCTKEADQWKYKVKSKMNWIWALLALVVILASWLALKYRK